MTSASELSRKFIKGALFGWGRNRSAHDSNGNNDSSHVFSSSTLDRDLANLRHFATTSPRASEVVRDMLDHARVAGGTLKRKGNSSNSNNRTYQSLYPQMVMLAPPPPELCLPVAVAATGSDDRDGKVRLAPPPR